MSCNAVFYDRGAKRPFKKYKKFNAKKRKRAIIAIVVVVIILSLLLMQYFLFAVPTIRLTSEEKIRSIATVAIEDAALSTFSVGYTHDDFVDITRDSDGNILLLQANTMLIHNLVRISSVRALENLSDLERDGLPIPLGAFFGAAIFAGYGPLVNLQVLSVAVMGTHLNSEFITAGINQTLHRITLTLSAEVTLILPGLQSQVLAAIPVPIIESTIIGRVPDVFFQNDLFNRSLNLAP